MVWRIRALSVCLASLALRTFEDFKSKSIFPMKTVIEILLITDEDSPLHTVCFTVWCGIKRKPVHV